MVLVPGHHPAEVEDILNVVLRGDEFLAEGAAEPDDFHRLENMTGSRIECWRERWSLEWTRFGARLSQNVRAEPRLAIGQNTGLERAVRPIDTEKSATQREADRCPPVGSS